MKRYRVTVNGVVYEVELEELTGESPAAASAPAASGIPVTAPMPGTILEISVQEGQQVEQGQVLMILEAMKMEHEIMSPQSGRVLSLSVSQGASVESGALLCQIQ